MVFFICNQILIEYSVGQSGDQDQILCSAAPDLLLHCLHMSNKKDARLIWVKATTDRMFDPKFG